MKVLIVDDEPLAGSRLQRLLESIHGVEVGGQARNGKEALLRSSSINPDIVLLDIRMPEMDGLETARHLSGLEHPPAIIFTTAFSEYALSAFDANAVDYLLKPIRKERLQEALNKAKKISRAQLVALGKQDQNYRARSHISATVAGDLQLVPVENIYYFHAEQKYITVRHTQGEVLIDDSLKQLEQEFGERFLRIHRNSLVAVDYIARLERDTSGKYQICCRNIDDQLEVSRRMAAAVKCRLKEMGRA